jgi:tRNA threonylcarbamoyladenosine biosynthesis protein TsaE
MSGEETTTHSEEETRAFGARMAAGLKDGQVVLIAGPLGAGKTCLVKGICQGLGVDPDEASSPSFTLIQEYTGGRLKVFHVDLYRLQGGRDLDSLGLEEIFGASGSVSLVEWPDKLGPHAPESAWYVEMERVEENTRIIRVFETASGAPASPEPLPFDIEQDL